MAENPEPSRPIEVTNQMWGNVVHRLNDLDKNIREASDEFIRLSERHEVLGNKHNELVSSHDELASSHDELSLRHHELKIAYDALVASAPVRASSSNPNQEPKIPDPPMYSGDKKELVHFLTKCRMKFEGQPSRFPSDRNKIIYVGTRLEGPAFSWFQPLMAVWPPGTPPESAPAQLQSYELFETALKELYGDPNQAATAERKLRMLKQLTSVAEYSARFEAERQYVKWNDPALRDQFYLGLKDNVKDQIALAGKPEKLKDLKELAVRIDSRLYERQLEQRLPPSTPKPSFPKSTPISPQYSFSPSMPKANPVSAPATPTRAPLTSLKVPVLPSDGTIPMELGTSGRYQLPAEERIRRRINNLCGYCGQANHTMDDCPIRPSRFRNSGSPSKRYVSTYEISEPTSDVAEKGPAEL